jgi:hypothetical protein
MRLVFQKRKLKIHTVFYEIINEKLKIKTHSLIKKAKR